MGILLTIVHVFVCLFLILTILLQAGRGGGMGLAFGGMSQQMFGGGGAAPFLAKITSTIAIIFFLTSASLAYLSSQQEDPQLQKRSESLQTQKKKAKAELEKRQAEQQKALDTAPPPSEVPPAPLDESAPGDIPAPPGGAVPSRQMPAAPPTPQAPQAPLGPAPAQPVPDPAAPAPAPAPAPAKQP